jgi:hypothetical protein
VGTWKRWGKQLCPCWLVEVLGMKVNTDLARNIMQGGIRRTCPRIVPLSAPTDLKVHPRSSIKTSQEDIRIMSGREPIKTVPFSCLRVHPPPNPARDRVLAHQEQWPKYRARLLPNIFFVALWRKVCPWKTLRLCAPSFLHVLGVQQGRSRGWGETKSLLAGAVVAARAMLPWVVLGMQDSAPTAVRTCVFELLPARRQKTSQTT